MFHMYVHFKVFKSSFFIFIFFVLMKIYFSISPIFIISTFRFYVIHCYICNLKVVIIKVAFIFYKKYYLSILQKKKKKEKMKKYLSIYLIKNDNNRKGKMQN